MGNLFIYLVLVLCVVESVVGTGNCHPASGRPFDDMSAVNYPIQYNAPLDPNSAAIVKALVPNTPTVDGYQYSSGIFDAYAGTPKKNVVCEKNWGTCTLENNPVPIPPNAQPAPPPDGDAHMTIIDWSTRTAYDFWEASNSSGKWKTGWGGVLKNYDTTSDVNNVATGTDMERLAGMVRLFEIFQGWIDHALVFSSSRTCANIYRYPALKTDGQTNTSDCIPEGARIQLDPTIDLDTIPNLQQGEKILAKALQIYGAYCIDTGGQNMTIEMEIPFAKPDPYPAAGFGNTWYTYFYPIHIPWNSLRVISSWNATSSPLPSGTPTRYYGCWQDSSSSHDLANVSLSHSAMTVQMCTDFCANYQFAYAGVSNTLCTCGDRFGKYGIAANSACSTNCPGLTSQKCGGTNYNSLFPSSLGYKGCYTDSASDLSSKVFTSTTMTVESCRSSCHTAGYSYAGLQAGNKCKCGNNYSLTNIVQTQSMCNTPCQGNSQQRCGGTSLNSIFTAVACPGYYC